ncbi:MAG: hypothetical protein K6E93_05470 [Bacteroidales bacterium]|jgi:MraZ protein|nr:hypothetical protein [Bacteroidales bacterium]
MALMLGKEYCKLDPNGRFKLPIALKRQLQSDDTRFVVKPSIYAECLELWTYASFEAEIEKLKSKLNPYSVEDRKLLRKFSEGNIVELDTNDRLVIPAEQKSYLKSGKELVLLSLGDWIEIWDRDTFQNAMNEQGTDYAAQANERLGQQQDNN